MVRQISGTLTITLKKQAENYTIEASGPKGIRVDPQPALQLETLLSDPQITDTRKDLSSQMAPATTDAIQKLGKALYDSLFTNQDILLAFGKAQGSASADNGVRLRLQIEPTELAALPWETLHDGKEWLSTQSSTPLVRKLNFSENRKTLQKLQIRGALRILFVGASPEGLDDLKVEKTANELETLLEGPIKKKQIVFDKLLNATLEDLQQGLLKDYHILYFAGHGSPEGIFLDDGEGDVIEKEDKEIRGKGDRSIVSAETIAQALKGKQTRLVFLAACETSKASDQTSEGSRLLRGFAQELAERSNLPAIVAMQYFISDMQANPLTTQFFAALAVGRPVDVAMAEARSGLMNKGQVNRDVFSPVLYLQAEDGALFPKAKNWLAISFSIAFLSAAILGGIFARSAETNQIQEWVLSSQNKLRGGDKLGAIIESLRANRVLQQSFFQKIWFDSQLKTSVLGQLQQIANTGQERNRLEVHQGRVWSVMFSPNGQLLATGGEDGMVRLWDISGRQLAVLKGHQGTVGSVAFSPNGQLLATGGEDGIVRLWDISGRQLAVLKGHQGHVWSVVFSPNGQLVATTSREDETVRLWDISGRQLAALKGHQGVIYDVVFSPDGQQLVTSGEDGIARLWDTSGRQLATLKSNQEFVWSVAFSPNGNLLVTGGEDGIVRLWNTSGQLLTAFNGHQGDVNTIVFSPDGQMLATGGKDDFVRLWNTSGQLLTAFNGHEGHVRIVVFSPDGQQLATKDDNFVRLWNISGKHLWDILGKPVTVLNGHQGTVYDVVFSPDSQLLATSGEDGTARLWGTSRRHLAEIDVNSYYRGFVISSSVIFRPDGQLLATSGDDGTVRLWDTSGQLLAKLIGNQGRAMVFSPDGKQLATSGYDDDIIRLWDASGQLSAELKGHQGNVYSIVFSSNGQLLATVGEDDDTVRLWDTSGRQLVKLNSNQGFISSVVFSPDGQLLATSGEDGTARLWDISGRQLAELKGHQGGVWRVVFSPNGQLLATIGEDGTARLWNTGGGQLAQMNVFQGDFDSVVMFSPNGQVLATNGKDSIVRLWDISGRQLAALTAPGGIDSVAFSPDGQLLATGGEDGTARLWVISGKQLAALNVHQGRVDSVVFSPNGQLLATSGKDGTARLWQVGGIDELFLKNCDWVRDYLKNGLTVVESDRHLCDGIGSRR